MGQAEKTGQKKTTSMILAYSCSVLMQTWRLCCPLGSWLTAQPTQAMQTGIQRLHGNTLLSSSPVPNVIPNCSAHVHFCNTGEEQALCNMEQHTACFNYYLERNIFLIL